MLLCAFCILHSALCIADVPTLLPAVGLKLPLPQEAVSQPIPPPAAKTYMLTRGNESWTEERFQALELWYASQHVAEWALPLQGVRLILGAVTLAPPVGFTDTDVTRDQFAAYTNSPQASVAQADARLLRLWMRDFSGCEVGEPQSMPVGRARLSHLLRYPTGRADIGAWLFHFNRSVGGLSYLPDVWIALVAVINEGTDSATATAYIEKTLLANLAPMGRFEGRETSTERLLRERARKSGVRPHPSRDAAHQSVASLADWWALDSEDYVLLSNGPTLRTFATDLLEDLQQARALYAQMFPGFADTSDNVAVVRLFATEAEYEAYVGPDYAWSGGIYDGNRHELIIRPVVSRSRDAAYQRALCTALHEGFHQYIHQATGIATPSVWFNEGFATFFEGLTFRNGRPVFDEDWSRFQILEAFLKAKPPQPVPLAALLVQNYEAFYAGTDNDRLFKYALAWGFTYFLERGAPLVRNKPYADILPTYYATLRTTGSAEAATAAAFQNVNLEALERDFRSFWTTPRSRSQAKQRK